MAGDEDHYGNIFQGQTEVLPDPFPKAAPRAIISPSPPRVPRR
jgi:hypothetical protein